MRARRPTAESVDPRGATVESVDHAAIVVSGARSQWLVSLRESIEEEGELIS